MKKILYRVLCSLGVLALCGIWQSREVQAATLSNPRVVGTGSDMVSTWDCVWFGNYYQSDATGQKKDPIKWRVLSVDGNDAFLISDKNLDGKEYNTELTDVTWETCTLRSWLNGYGSTSNVEKTDYRSDNFINTAFTSGEQNAIIQTEIVNDDNPDYGIAGGDNTSDKVYLLSIEEAVKTIYGFHSDYSFSTYAKTRVSLNTAYAKRRGVGNTKKGGWGWWLRSPGYDSNLAALVFDYGYLHSYGFIVSDCNPYEAVRPVLHLNLSSSNVWSYAGTVCSDGTVDEQEPNTGIPSIKDTSTDDYMIEQVKKYTSDDVFAQYDKIVKANSSSDMMFKQLDEMFSNRGLTDSREGVKYLSQTSSHRDSYLYLTTDQTYGAFNFWNWLYSPAGTLPRGLLYADGLIFNGEVFAYKDLSTYTETDYPGVKKNKEMLKQFMAYESPKSEVFENANRTAKFFKNLLQLNNIKENAEMDALMDQIINCTSDTELEHLRTKFVNDCIEPQGIDTIYLNGEPFAKALNSASSIVSFAGATTDDILGILNMSNEMETYKKYEKFLKTIYNNTDVSFEMRLAAYSLLDTIGNGYYNKVRSILGNCITLEGDLMDVDKSLFSTFFGEGGELTGGALDTIKLATFISNIVVDTGDFVRQAAYTQGYAEISTLYSLKLQEDKTAFQQEQTAENAWQFFEDYNLLWELRYQGEEQYLKMNSIKMYIFSVVKTFDYDLKEEMVKNTLAGLRTREFEISDEIVIPESVQYTRKAVINCPVDVDVYTKDGQLVTTLKDGIPSDISNEYGRFAVVYQAYSGEYAKVICQSTSEPLELKITAVSDGYVDYQMASSEQKTESVFTFDKVMVSTGDRIDTTTDTNDLKYSIYKNGEKEPEATETMKEKNLEEQVKVSDLELGCDSVQMEIGAKKNVKMKVLPSDATNTDVNWMSSNEDIVSSKNGVLTAKQEGIATVYVKALDSSDVQKQIKVEVIKKVIKESEKNDEVKVQRVQIVGISNQIAAGKKITLKANITPANAANKALTWKSSNTKVATVSSNGVVSVKKKTGGKSVIITATAKDGSGKSATYKIKSMKGVVKKVTLSGRKTVKVGSSLKLKAKVSASKGANKKLKWESNNTKYAIVSSSGKVKTKKAGKGKTVKITVKSTDGSNKSKLIKIKIK